MSTQPILSLETEPTHNSNEGYDPIDGSEVFKPKNYIKGLWICGGVQIATGLFVQLGYICSNDAGVLSSPFGLLCFATGVTGLVWTLLMHSTCLNRTYVVFSILTTCYALAYIIILFTKHFSGNICFSMIGASIICLVTSIFACIFCYKANKLHQL